MSVKAMTWAFEQAIPPTLKVVLLALADHADENHVCWPSIPKLAAKTSMSDRTVQRSLYELQEQGYIEKNTRMSERGDHTSNHYLLKVRVGGGVKLSPGGGDTVVTRVVSDCHHGGDTVVTTIMNPQLEPSIETIEEARALAGKILRDEGFDLSSWEDGFLSNLVGLHKWSKDQREKFDAIASRYARKALEEPKPLFEGPRPTVSNGKTYVKLGTPEWHAAARTYLLEHGKAPPVDARGGWWFSEAKS